MELGTHTWHEIQSQPEAWAAALESVRAQAAILRDFYHEGQYEQVLLTGCGSTYYLAVAAAALFQDLTGTPARGLPASEIWLYPRSALSRHRTLLIAIGRSGETTETLRACRVFLTSPRAEGCDILTLCCSAGQPLTTLGALNLVFPAGQEKSIAQTRAFTTLYIASVALAVLWAGRDDWLNELARLPEIGGRLLTNYADLARERSNDANLDRFYFLGSGPRYGLACELSLKMKEMSLSHSEPFQFMEFRHGPKSMVNEHTLIVGLVSETNRAHETLVLDEMRSYGAHILTMAEAEADVVFNSQAREAIRDVLYLPFGQMLAFYRSLNRGLDPDHPKNLEAVVRLNACSEFVGEKR